MRNVRYETGTPSPFPTSAKEGVHPPNVGVRERFLAHRLQGKCFTTQPFSCVWGHAYHAQITHVSLVETAARKRRWCRQQWVTIGVAVYWYERTGARMFFKCVCLDNYGATDEETCVAGKVLARERLVDTSFVVNSTVVVEMFSF